MFVDLHLFGLNTIAEPFSIAAFCYMGILLTAAIGGSLVPNPYRNLFDRNIFWILGYILCAFAIFRPFGLALDDPSYVRILSDLCPGGDCLNGSPITRDFIWFWLVSLGLPYWPESLTPALALSGLGIFIKLFIIDRLCRQRILALLLLVPLSFFQYDLTQMRAGFASAWMMLGIYWLVRSQLILGGVTLISNVIVHSQGAFSPILLSYRLLNLYRWLFPLCLIILLGLIFLRLTPSESILSWLGLTEQTATYLSALQNNEYAESNAFALGNLPILGYGVWLWSTASEKHKNIANIVATSILLGVSLAWFFSIITVMQTRLFDFYMLPIVLLVGNIGNEKHKLIVTCFLALVLYLRLELIQDWILG